MAEMRPLMPLLFVIVFALAGCGEEPAVRVYETTRPAAYVWPQADADARTDEHEINGVTWAWDVPEGFVDAPQLPDRLIADYRFKGANEELPGRLTVSMIPGEAGGVMANVQRWQRQLYMTEPMGLSKHDLVTPMITPNNLELVLVRLTGQYRGPHVPTDLLGAIILVRTPGGEVMQSWFFKMVGDRETIEANTHLFPRIYTSFRVSEISPELLAEFRTLTAEAQKRAEQEAQNDGDDAASNDDESNDPAPIDAPDANADTDETNDSDDSDGGSS